MRTQKNLNFLFACYSVYNDRTSIYKNSHFDYVLDQTASQRRIYDRAEIGEMVRAVVDVS